LVGVAGVGAALRWGGSGLSPEDAIVTIVHKRLGYLSLDEPGVRQFAKDYVAATNISGIKLRLIAALAPIYRRLPTSPANRVARGTRYGEERVVTCYLLSTDFFPSGSDEARTVRYTGLYDPLRACGNPFRRPVLSSNTA
jgi:hypothetical protein